MGIVSCNLTGATDYFDAVRCRFLSAVYTFHVQNEQRPVDITRHVVVQSDGGTLANCQIDIRTPTVLNSLDYQLIYPTRESQLPAEEVLRAGALSAGQPERQILRLYDRESTIKALRLALPRDRFIDVKLHVLLRSDALRAGGKIWNRSRSRLTPLKGLWEPILQIHVSNNLVDRAKGIMHFFKMFGTSLAQLTIAGAAVLTSPENWQSRFGTELSLKDSLMLEFESGESVERRRREAEAALEIINEPKRGFFSRPPVAILLFLCTCTRTEG